MRRLIVLPIILIIPLFIFGCTGVDREKAESATGEGAYPLTIEDSLGRQVVIPEKPRRIVSLAPANTEILFSLGLGEKVVGVTDYCDYPVEAQSKEKVGDFYAPSVEKTLILEPDVIFATGGVQSEVVEQLDSLGQVVVALDPKSIDEILEAVRLTGKVTGSIEQAQQITRDMEQRIKAVRDKLADLSPGEKVDTFVLVWIEDSKVFSAGPGTFVSSIISLAGGYNVADESKVEYPQYSIEKLMEKNPEVIISTAHGYSNPEQVKEVLHLDNLAAVKNDKVFIVEDSDLLTLPGPRIVDGLELVSHFLHPDIFPSH